MSKFEQSAVKANEHVFNAFGIEAVYKPKAGGELETTVLAGPINGELDESDGSQTKLRHRVITVPIADVTSPDVGDIITIDSIDWTVTEPPDIETGLANLQTRYDEAVSKASEFGKKKLPA